MDKIGCEVVRDLLPLYADNAVSDASRALVEGHLSRCEDCKKMLENCKKEVGIAPEFTIDPLKAVRRKQRRKIIAIALAAAACVAAILLACFHLYNKQFPIPYDYETMRVSYENGMFNFYHAGLGYNMGTRTVHIEKDGMEELVLFYYYSQSAAGRSYHESLGNPGFPSDIPADVLPDADCMPPDEDYKRVSRIYYLNWNGFSPEELIAAMDTAPLVWAAENAPLLFPVNPQG